MKKMRLLQGTLAVGIGVGLLGAMTTTASANSQYSSARANSVRLVWRRSMGQHTYTATQGARYSKHLGVRYSNNDVTPTVTWYTDAHEKLYRKNKGSSAIYYHVKSADGTLQGWIWRGYLKSVTGATNKTSEKNNGIAAESGFDDSLANNWISELHHKATPDTSSMNKAKVVLNQAVSSKYHFETQIDIAKKQPNFSSRVNLFNGVNIAVIDNSDFSRGDKAEATNFNQYRQLLSNNGLSQAGIGVNKYQTLLVIAKDQSVFENNLSGEFAPGDYAWTNGITSNNYFAPVKIGVAVKKLSNGQYAMFAMFNFPDKYNDLKLS